MRTFTREELESLNMDEAQINAIMTQQNISNKNFQVVENDNEPDVNVVDNVQPKQLSEYDITTISEIQKFSSGTIVELPAFDGSHPFVAKLKRPSLLVLVKTGKIPNSLINQATQLFQRGAGSLGKDNTIGDMYDIMETICESALVKPTYKEIKDADLSLTDEQMMAIFSFTQQGVKALEQFR